MRKYFILIIFTHTVFISTFAQRNKIDSLNKVLPTLRDTARINCLNELSKYYCNYDNSIPHYARTDSAELCANEAYSEAVSINYKSGIGNTFLNLGKIYLRRYNFFTAKQYVEKAINVFKNIKAEPELFQGYSILEDVFLSEDDYTSAISYSEMLVEHYKKKKDPLNEANAWDALRECYMWEGNYEKAFECMQNGFNLLKNLSDSSSILAMLKTRQALYQFIGWNDSVASCAAKIVEYEKKTNITVPDTIDEVHQTGFKYFMEKKWDSAEYYNKKLHNYIESNKGIDSIIKERNILRNDIDIASVYQKEGRYQEALPMFMKALQYDRERNVAYEELEELLNISQIYDLEGKETDAIHYAQNLLSLAQKTQSGFYTQNAYEQLWKIYNKKKDSANAYKYYAKYTVLKDSTLTGTFQRKLAVINELTNEKEQQLQIAALDKENKLKEAAIQKNVLIKNILLAGIAILILLGFIIYRLISLKRKNEKLQNQQEQSQLQHKANLLEMQALRAQMNPHFIFNCLSSINRFILKNKTEEASDYLTKFSRLIRMVLNNSKQSFISLEDELETLKLYLEMERLRFKNAFDYSFTYQNSVNTNNIFLPPLLLQPFAENAIWHGLMQRQEKGFLNFDFSAEEKFLICVITDNGIGREQAELLKSKSVEKQKSMGLKITTERLSLLNNNSNQQTFFTIEDLTDENENATGTRVHLKIFYKEMIQV